MSDIKTISRMSQETDVLSDVLTSIDARRDESVRALCEFLSIPSVSTKPEHRPDMLRCATWLAEQMRASGLEAQLLPTPGHPVVLAKNQHIAGRPTVLLYGHYDVQPPEPLDLWTSPAFEPQVRGGAIYARGACDDKGQVWAHVEAIRAWQQQGGLPINLIALIEGEEEIGSANLDTFVQQHREKLNADIAIVSDTNQFARGVPAITYGLRGLVYMEVSITGPSHDLHSGLFGGTVANPANVLSKLLGSLIDEDGRVTIAGFYDDVLPLSDAERAAWKQLPFDESQYAKSLGVDELFGERGYSSLERRWARPTCDINGLTSGYQGPGAKTVLPSKASAKVSMRLVPNQKPEKIAEAFEQALRARCPKSVTIEVHCHSSTAAVLVPAESAAMKLASEAVEIGFGKAPVLIREGGSIPVVSLLKKRLGIDSLLVGFGLPDDRIHSPNEKFDLEALRCGSRAAGALYGKLSQL